MSGAAGALALAATLPPAASSILPTTATSGDLALRPFEGLLADTESGNSETLTIEAASATQDVDAAPVMPATAPVAAMPVTPTAPAATAPPPMDDPATASVLNALALRVATENRTPAALADLSAGLAANGAKDNSLLPPSALAISAASNTVAKQPDAQHPASFAAAAVASGVVGVLRSASSGAPGIVPLPSPDAAAQEGDAASLDALLSRLGALLPATSTKATTPPSAVRSAPAAPVPLAPAIPAVPALPPAVAADPGKATLDALAEPGALATGGDSNVTPSSMPSVSTATSAVAPFSVQLGAAAATAGAAPRADGAQPPIQVPFDSPQWGNELATRVVSLAREQFSEAEIRVTPDELGPIEVKLRFEGERVHAQFGAISPEAREALTANLHRLREMFASEGLNLAQAFVGHQGQDGAQRFDSPGARGKGSGSDGDDEALPIAPRMAIAARRGLLDEFA